MPFLILPIVWIAAACGRRIHRLLLSGEPVLPLERSLFGLATGLGVLSYGVLAIGLAGKLTALPALVLALVLGVVGWSEHGRLASEIAQGVRALRISPSGALFALLFAAFAGVALVGCFAPPAGLEWDSLSYHLADPKIYLQNHRILYLPWESHSNFAFTMEMLYTLGLMVHSVPLAKLFHFSLAVTGALATYRVGARLFSASVGRIAALAFVSLPLVFWEAGTAYVDLAATAFGMLALLALVNKVTVLPTEEKERSRTERRMWLLLSAFMMGWMVSVKATSLITLVLLGIFLWLWLWRAERKRLGAAFGTAVLWGIVALVIGSVWYIKSWLCTGNPFYPFGYSVFGGRYWDAANAAQYAKSNASFGVGRSLADLLILPWNLTMSLLPGHPVPMGHKGFNDVQTPAMALSPLFLAALFVPAFWKGASSKAASLLLAYALASLVIWFFLTQQVRYLLPVMPVFCLLAAYVLDRAVGLRMRAGWMLGALFALSVAFSLYIGGGLVSYEAPVAFHAVSQSDYLLASDGATYRAMQYLNTQTPPDAKVVLYGEPRGFYCDREYLWGDPGHSLFIPYARLQTPAALAAYLRERGYRYILVNYRGAPLAPGPGWAGMVFALTLGSGHAPLFADHGVYVYGI